MTHRVIIPILVALASLAPLGCGEAASDGRECGRDPDCATGICVAARCVAPDEDPDGDGLTNRDERRAGSHPFDPDSDDDGLPDGVEVGTGTAPTDSDGDGRADAVECLTADQDADCVPDPWDAYDDDPSHPEEPFLRALFCRGHGVCGEQVDARRVRCEAGLPRCDYSEVEGFEADEGACDGRDNDCDGRTDEDLAFEGLPLGAPCPARGTCASGIVECAPVRLRAVCSTHEGGSASMAEPERCDRLDNDCDGATDEDVLAADGTALGGPCNGRGACGPGVVECEYASERAICSSEPGGSSAEAVPEVCDGRDDDCDGETDEGLVAPGGERCRQAGVCGNSEAHASERCREGLWVCDYADVPGFEGDEESSCDGLDNDCDGATDEAFVYEDFDLTTRRVGEPCGTGACTGGVVACSGDEGRARCSTDTARGEERCNGLDDDCDGRTDEDVQYGGKPLGQACVGIGACGSGFVECTPSGTVTCSSNPDGSAPEDTAESCDGRDNDCDGTTDEGLGAPPTACDAPGVCAGTLVTAWCHAGEWTCDYSALEDFEEGPETRCDGLDNTCDGRVDELLPKRFARVWQPLDAGTPPVRGGAALAPLGDGARVLLFGGEAGAGSAAPLLLDDAWTLSLGDGAWTPFAAPGPERPRPRADARFVFDTERQRLLLVGGRVGAEDAAGSIWALGLEDGAWTRLELNGVTAARVDAAAALDVAGRLWVYGGATAADVATLAAFEPSTATWWDVDAGPPPVRGASLDLDAVTGDLVAFGGRGPDGTPVQRTVVVHPPANGSTTTTWQEHPARLLPPARSDHMTFVDTAGRRLLVFGGVDTDGGVLADLWAFSLDARSWGPVATYGAPAVADGLLTAGLDDRTLLLVGGRGAGGRPNGTVWRLDLESGAWSAAPGPVRPPPLRDAAAALDALGRRWFVVGGRRPLVAGEALSDETWTLDLATNAWQELPPLGSAGPVARAEAAAFYDGALGRLVVHGGVVASATGAEQVDDTVWTLDPLTRTWARAAEDGPALAGHSAVLDRARGVVHVFGGRTPEGPSADLWTLDLVTLAWHREPPAPISPPALQGHAALWDPVASEMVVVGGTGGGGQILRYAPSSGAWWVVATLPELAATSPVAWLDPLSPELVVGAWPSGASAPFLLRVVDGSPWLDTFDAPLPDAVRGGVGAYDPSARRAYLFGGAGPLPVARDTLWILEELCP